MKEGTTSDYTEAEFLEFVRKICRVEDIMEEDDSRLVNEFRRSTGHPNRLDLIYYLGDNREDSLESIVKEVREWRVARRLPGFKAD